ncbi:hypothetical protein J6590_020405 [Homalodisca vitripennis]|nr:hypothetical protein J6590_020405 [Homalodisca vitripennis]
MRWGVITPHQTLKVFVHTAIDVKAAFSRAKITSSSVNTSCRITLHCFLCLLNSIILSVAFHHLEIKIVVVNGNALRRYSASQQRVANEVDVKASFKVSHILDKAGKLIRGVNSDSKIAEEVADVHSMEKLVNLFVV